MTVTLIHVKEIDSQTISYAGTEMWDELTQTITTEADDPILIEDTSRGLLIHVN